MKTLLTLSVLSSVLLLTGCVPIYQGYGYYQNNPYPNSGVIYYNNPPVYPYYYPHRYWHHPYIHRFHHFVSPPPIFVHPQPPFNGPRPHPRPLPGPHLQQPHPPRPVSPIIQNWQHRFNPNQSNPIIG